MLIPGQGEYSPDLLDPNFSEKIKWLELSGKLLGNNITKENFKKHDFNSALLVANALAIFEHFKIHGGEIQVVSGYSIGQYAALGISGVLSFEKCLELAVLRARIMQKHTSSEMGMLSVIGLSSDDLLTCINSIIPFANQSDDCFLEISNMNSTANQTVAGNINLLKELASFAINKGARKVNFLKVQGAWHSRMLNSAVGEFEKILNSYSFANPTIKYIDNVSGKCEQKASVIKQNLIKHLVSTVRWEQAMKTMIDEGVKSCIECGASKQLIKILFFIDRRIRCIAAQSPEEIQKCVELLV